MILVGSVQPVPVPEQPVPEQQRALSSDASLSALAVYRAIDKQLDGDNVVRYAGSAYVLNAETPDTYADPSSLSPLVAGYDTNSDGNLDKYENRVALRDFSARKISLAQIQEVRAAYYASRR